ncbi:MAG: GntR family transcriptional regulator [Spirochaetales bacterium]|nr:GntR family transcriptional regulator [Spirochaetales bacterium]
MRGISISNKSNKPIYQQLFEQISSQILKGELESDFNLPAIRTAAKELRISIITVKKAWEKLERDGLIYSVAGKGCFISDLSNNELGNKRTNIIRKQMLKDLLFYKNLGISEDEIIKLVKELYSKVLSC